MSTMHAARPRQRTTRQARPTSLPLRLVAPVRSRASRAPFVVVVLTVLGAGLVGLILLSTVLQAQAFEIARLSTRAGMVPNANPAFLRPSDGEVIGDPEPAAPRSNVTRVDR